MSKMQGVVAMLCGLGLSNEEIAGHLRVSKRVVIWHIRNAAAKIPGDLRAKERVTAWVRGASLDVLEGRSLRAEFMVDAQRASREARKLGA